ncbi:MAG TPA: septal ring lytic transglycosylase RlpA family protein [Methylomirabilota bacterium]|nr:septal ring lytic transglycosylase RlpA family protein [Methylomirabilota bacterium]
MRRPKVVAVAALIAAFATVAVPGTVGSRAPSSVSTPSADLFASVEIAAVRGPTMTTPPLDPNAESDGNLDESSTLLEPDLTVEPPQARVVAAQPQAKAGAIKKNTWRFDGNVSWYGPGFYGRRTACGKTMTEGLIGVAHRTLPCGTRITFKSNGRVVTAPVVDRGPYVSGRTWDLTGGLCLKLRHCYTGSISWKYASGG